MTSEKFAGRCCGVMMTAPHATGHAWAKDGTLLRFDCERGHGWVATHYDLRLRVLQQVRGSYEDVHRVVACWARR
jgi:hypothetical protein